MDHVNRVQYARLKGEEYVYNYTSDCERIVYIETGLPIPPEKMRECRMLTGDSVVFETRKILDGSNFQQILRLKIGTVVMCIVNLDMDSEICNGSQGIVVSFQPRNLTDLTLYPTVKFHNGVTRLILPFFRQGDEFPSIAVGQVPLIPAWAMSIHKCQGATMDIAEIDIGRTIFEYGQSYVALGRVKSLEGLYLSGFDPSRIKTHQKVIDFYADFIDIREMIDIESKELDARNNIIHSSVLDKSITSNTADLKVVSTSKFFSQTTNKSAVVDANQEHTSELDFEKYNFVVDSLPSSSSTSSNSISKKS